MTEQAAFGFFDALDTGPILTDPACGEQGPLEAWIVVPPKGRKGRPRCNRPAGHSGRHGRYARDASVLAAWAPYEAPTDG